MTEAAALFVPLSLDENMVLAAHLGSGAAKQHVLWPVNGEAWNETMDLLKDLHLAWTVRFGIETPGRAW